MNVNELLDTIEDLLEESTGMPLSGGKRIVDVEQIRDYLDDIRANLPVELRQDIIAAKVYIHCITLSSARRRSSGRPRHPF